MIVKKDKITISEIKEIESKVPKTEDYKEMIELLDTKTIYYKFFENEELVGLVSEDYKQSYIEEFLVIIPWKGYWKRMVWSLIKMRKRINLSPSIYSIWFWNKMKLQYKNINIL